MAKRPEYEGKTIVVLFPDTVGSHVCILCTQPGGYRQNM